MTAGSPHNDSASHMEKCPDTVPMGPVAPVARQFSGPAKIPGQPLSTPRNTGEDARARTATVLLVAGSFVVWAAQNPLAPNLSAAAADFGFDPEERDAYLGGGLSAALFLAGAPAAALLFGYLADISQRNVLYCAACGLACGAACAVALCRSYNQLFWARVATGMSFGAVPPVQNSIVGDLFNPAERTVIMGHLGIANGVGVGFGQWLGGLVGPQLGWRFPFVVVAIMLGAFTCCCASCMHDPLSQRAQLQRRFSVRSLKDSVQASVRNWPHHRHFLRTPTLWIILGQSVFGCLPWGAINTFFIDYMHVEHGHSVAAATVASGCFGVGVITGVVAGTQAGQFLYNLDPRYQPLYCGVTVAAGTLPIAALWLCRLPIAITCIVAAVGGFFASQADSNVRAVLQNVTPPRQRGLAFAVFTSVNSIGTGLGPILVAGLITAWGRRSALLFATLGWIPCALLNAAVAFTVVQDENEMEQRMVADPHNECDEKHGFCFSTMRARTTSMSALRGVNSYGTFTFGASDAPAGKMPPVASRDTFAAHIEEYGPCLGHTPLMSPPPLSSALAASPQPHHGVVPPLRNLAPS